MRIKNCDWVIVYLPLPPSRARQFKFKFKFKFKMDNWSSRCVKRTFEIMRGRTATLQNLPAISRLHARSLEKTCSAQGKLKVNIILSKYVTLLSKFVWNLWKFHFLAALLSLNSAVGMFACNGLVLAYLVYICNVFRCKCFACSPHTHVIYDWNN